MIENRVCSYCKKPHHNRRGCKLLKEDVSLVERRQLEYREEFLDVSSSAGLSLGTLIKVPTGDDPNAVRGEHRATQGFVGMVVGFNWFNIDFLNKDTDITRGWSMRSRNFLNTRVISSYGYPEEIESGGWRSGPPKFNDIKPVSLIHLHKILGPIVSITTADLGSDAEYAAEIIAPVHNRSEPPVDTPLITGELNKRFHFHPERRADEWEKQRPPLHGEQWSRVRESEHLEAVR